MHNVPMDDIAERMQMCSIIVNEYGTKRVLILINSWLDCNWQFWRAVIQLYQFAVKYQINIFRAICMYAIVLTTSIIIKVF